jgi:hypothetical protein
MARVDQGPLGRVERTLPVFRSALYSPLAPAFRSRERHNIRPCPVQRLPLTEARLRNYRTIWARAHMMSNVALKVMWRPSLRPPWLQGSNCDEYHIILQRGFCQSAFLQRLQTYKNCPGLLYSTANPRFCMTSLQQPTAMSRCSSKSMSKKLTDQQTEE